MCISYQRQRVSTSDEQYVSRAAEAALNSQMLMKHGCVAVLNGKIIATGCNNDRNYSNDGFVNHNVCSCHAEIDVLRKVYHSCMSSNTKGKAGNWRKVFYSKGL